MNACLITGGAGFLGSHLCERLLASGCVVICVDNFHTGQLANITHLREYPSFKLLQHDIVLPISTEADQIYNLACPASPIHYQRDALQTIRTSINGAINMLDLAKRLNAKILQASSSEVYGDPLMHPQMESYWGNVNPVGVRSCYDEGKRCAETIFMNYFRQYNLRIKISRIFNTYGPRMHPRDGRVIPNFVIQALKGKEITVYGDGRQTRSFCYVDDMIDGLIRLMNTKDEFTGPVNLGNPCECTIFDLAKIIIDITGSKSHIVFKALPSDDPKQRRPDISLAEAALNWKPEVRLEQGLLQTILYFDKTM
jgi:UDP-glucuronate decarboxylase